MGKLNGVVARFESKGKGQVALVGAPFQKKFRFETAPVLTTTVSMCDSPYDGLTACIVVAAVSGDLTWKIHLSCRFIVHLFVSVTDPAYTQNVHACRAPSFQSPSAVIRKPRRPLWSGGGKARGFQLGWSLQY